jgi:transcription-repair coupling factor (superfamily II helicase)
MDNHMHLIGLTDLLRETQGYREQLARLNESSQTWNLIRSARPFVLASIARDWPAPILYLTTTGRRAYNVVEQLPVWLEDESRILRFAEPTPMFYDRLPWDRTVIRERLDTLQALLYAEEMQKRPIIVASIRALMQRTMPIQEFRKRSNLLKVGQRYSIGKLIEQWLSLGYEPVTMVLETGTFSRRGGILDVFPLASALPIRLEFFDDELETLRTFDPATQRTVASISQMAIVPAREVAPELMPQVARHLEAWFKEMASSDELSSLQQDYEAMTEAQTFAHLEHYQPYAAPNPVSLLDYASPDTLIIVDDLEELQQAAEALAEEAENNRINNIKTHQLPADYPHAYVDWPVLADSLNSARVLNLANLAEGERLFTPAERFGGQIRPAMRFVREHRNHGEKLVIVTQQLDRMEGIWYEQDATATIPKTQELLQPLASGEMTFMHGELSGGWVLESEKGRLHLITDAEIFGWQRPEPRRRKAAKRGGGKLPESDYNDWREGDYVVHVDYGIGRFKGLQSRTIENNEREYLILEYADNGMLYVPIHQADRLTRYVGPDEVPPRLNTLGKQETWLKTKEKAQKNALEEAAELLSIYAYRANAQGFAFAPDGAWQRELEASFPYVETEDQVRVIREIKHDMEAVMPMDRLVCGDVGYGKTEVALRAAFKAVQDGKQVAVLVPTTVLANQHYETFTLRMAEFPLKIEMMSRFRTKAEQSRALTEIAAGNVDIVIGTHRLLSEDVTFKNLGLVIIDEEQRFGVKDKEHFKKLRANVDVLTLTATPIPRTLYMSLAGVRDISMLQTPPEDRLPVITHVSPFDSKLLRQAVLRELDRGGQVFVIHNRVKSIETLREKLEDIVPEASIVVAHGQMGGHQLEQVISEFSKGQYDILLATTIIESGIDMPNVNTLIVDRADWFGMSQLYQIRGRVGRSASQAFAYFFHAGSKKLTEDARERLETLAEYTHLGSGFQISIRDLELRGAGDILSTKQTGHVATVGLQLYTQLLQQAVAELKGEADGLPKPSYEQERVIIDLPIPAYIPEDWIAEMALRLQLYRRIGNLQTMDEIEAMRQELRDRFGLLPLAVEGLLYQIQVKILAVAINASAIVTPREHILIKLPWLQGIDRESLAKQLIRQLKMPIEVSRTAVELRFDEDLWQLQLIDLMGVLEAGLPEQMGAE